MILNYSEFIFKFIWIKKMESEKFEDFAPQNTRNMAQNAILGNFLACFWLLDQKYQNCEIKSKIEL